MGGRKEGECMWGREESGWEEGKRVYVGKRGEWVRGRKEESGRVKLVSFPWSVSCHEKEPGYKTREKGRESKPNGSREMLTTCRNW